MADLAFVILGDDTVKNLATSGAKIVIISNSSRRASTTIEKLEGLGFDPSFFTGAITSGELTHQSLQRRDDPWFAALGRRCIHMTWKDRGAISLEVNIDKDMITITTQSESITKVSSALLGEALAMKAALIVAKNIGIRELNCFSDSLSLITLINTNEVTNELRAVLFDIHCLKKEFTSIFFAFIPRSENVLADSLAKFGIGLDLNVVENVEEANFVLAHGTEALGLPSGGVTPTPLDELEKILEKAAARGLPMTVANPDYVTVEANVFHIMPGTLASKYEELGGEVKWMGRPYKMIYDSAMGIAGVNPSESVAVGDSLHHDIKGANVSGIESVFTTGGIHGNELGLTSIDETASPDSVKTLTAKHNAFPTYVLPSFKW